MGGLSFRKCKYVVYVFVLRLECSAVARVPPRIHAELVQRQVDLNTTIATKYSEYFKFNHGTP
jgi:hypothetical protein